MSTTSRIPVAVERVGNFLADVERLYEAISAKADEYFAGRGSINGYDIDDWVRAENDLVVKPDYKLSRQNRDVIVEMTLPDRELLGLTIRLTPHDMLLSSEPDDQGRRIFRIVRFRDVIDWTGIDAEMIGNKLRIVAEVARQPESRTCSQSA